MAGDPLRLAAVLGIGGGIVVAALAGALGWLIAGGAVGVSIGVGCALAVAFFGVTSIAALLTRRLGAQVLAAVVLGGWLLKLLALIVILGVIVDLTGLQRIPFALALVLTTVVYLMMQAVVVLRVRQPYVVPSEDSTRPGRVIRE